METTDKLFLNATALTALAPVIAVPDCTVAYAPKKLFGNEMGNVISDNLVITNIHRTPLDNKSAKPDWKRQVTVCSKQRRKSEPHFLGVIAVVSICPSIR